MTIHRARPTLDRAVAAAKQNLAGDAGLVWGLFGVVFSPLGYKRR